MLLVKELECQVVNLKKLKDIRQNMGPISGKEVQSGTNMDNAETLPFLEIVPASLSEAPKAWQCCCFLAEAYAFMILRSFGVESTMQKVCTESMMHQKSWIYDRSIF